MNKKLLLGALIGAGMSMLNKKIRQQSAPSPGTPPPDFHRPDFSKVPPPEQTGGAGGPSLDDILARAGKPGGWSPDNGAGGGQGPGGDIFGGAVPAGAGAGGAAVLMEIARRIFEQMQQSGGAAPGGAPGGGMGGGLGDVLGQIFGRAGGKFGQQGPQGPQSAPGNWQNTSPRGEGGLFGFVNSADEGAAAPGVGEDQADAMLKAMVAAAQADGRIDEAEQHNILQALDGQLESSTLDAFRQFLTQPVNLDDVVSAANDPATAFNLYLVSAMTINPDNAQEKQYLAALAEKLGISEQAAQAVEQQLPR
ncbi:DUF533 domain-containing protein [Microbulbifer mangrovi]|uniref:DUF533 domain-containing protein n=1 Tax=Microbulbifer mangrovi TaxID=927787 RepID=UPI000990843F|nr:DUF533 domain-containing protein [Microbulbifer mangrovi]